MLLIEWNRPCSMGIGSLKLHPGINEVHKAKWESAISLGYERAVKVYQDNGDIVVHNSDKPTIAIVNKTYNMEILEDWLVEAKGPLKGAIKQQIKLMNSDKKVG